jgi:hypothetical protein
MTRLNLVAIPEDTIALPGNANDLTIKYGMKITKQYLHSKTKVIHNAA